MIVQTIAGGNQSSPSPRSLTHTFLNYFALNIYEIAERKSRQGTIRWEG